MFVRLLRGTRHYQFLWLVLFRVCVASLLCIIATRMLLFYLIAGGMVLVIGFGASTFVPGIGMAFWLVACA